MAILGKYRWLFNNGLWKGGWYVFENWSCCRCPKNGSLVLTLVNLIRRMNETILIINLIMNRLIDLMNLTKKYEKNYRAEGTWTLNLLVRSQTPYPLGHGPDNILISFPIIVLKCMHYKYRRFMNFYKWLYGKEYDIFSG